MSESKPEIIDVQAEVVPTEPKVRAGGKREELISSIAIKPGGSGQMPIKLSGGKLLDVEVDADAEILRIMIGQETVERGLGESWASAIARVEGGGAYAIVIAQNNGSEERVVQGSVWIVPGAASASASANAPRVGGRRDASVTENTVIGTAPVRPATTVVTPKRIVDARQVPMARVRRLSPPSSVTEEIVSSPAPAGSAVVSSGSSVSAASTGRHMGGDVVGVLPRDGEHVAYMSPGHAHGLLRHLKTHAPLLPAFKTTIVRQLLAALDRAGAAGVVEGSSEILVVLPRLAIQHVIGIVRGTMGPLSPREKAIVVGAIESALERQGRPLPRVENPAALAASNA